MEFYYFLNEDCVSNFEFADYFISKEIFTSSKPLSRKFKYITYLNTGKYGHHKSGNILDRLHLFCNITYVKKYRRSLNLLVYFISYKEKYPQYPPLRILKSYSSIENIEIISLFPNLICLNLSGQSVRISNLNNLSNLTYLKFKLKNEERIQLYHHCSNLKILYLCNYSYDSENKWNNDKFASLQKLKLNIESGEGNIYFSCSHLTFLKTFSYSPHIVPTIYLEDKINLKYLLLDCVNIDQRYIQRASSLVTLKINHESNIILENKIHSNLKHLSLRNIKSVTLKNMTNLITPKFKNIIDLKIE